jgi:hypothetical protein
MIPQVQNNEELFLVNADAALEAMNKESLQMNIKGVGILAFLDNNKENWMSKMKVMGALKNDEANFLAIAYTKAGEMVDTLKNSGTTERKPLLGEFNFLGGIIKKVNNGYIIAVFSGATGEEDTVVAEVGMQLLLDKWN